MIKLERNRTSQTLPSGLRGAALKKKNLDLLKLKRQKTKLASSDFKSNLWKPAKDHLLIESVQKCAYCEADTRVVAHGDVEHFRPKTLYWWLAYSYDNYLFSCQICNQTFKSNSFPRSGAKMRGPSVKKTSSDAQLKAIAEKMTVDPLNADEDPSLAGFIGQCEAEQADLIDPYMVDPEEMLIWEVDEQLGHVRVDVSDDVPRAAKIRTAINKFYGLNREELLERRFRTWHTVRTIAALVEPLGLAGLDEEVEKLKIELRRMVDRTQSFAGMNRFFVFKVWEIDLG